MYRFQRFLTLFAAVAGSMCSHALDNGGMSVGDDNGPLIAHATQQDGKLPFEERFNNFLKGTFRGSNGVRAWYSGTIDVFEVNSISVSFDTSSGGTGLKDETVEPTDFDYLRVWVELDGEPLGQDLLYVTGKNPKAIIEKDLNVEGGRSLEFKVESRTSNTRDLYYVDNIRIEAPEAGLILKPEVDEPYVAPPSISQPAVETGVIQYALTPRFVPSTTYEANINEVSIPVESLYSGLAQTLDPHAKDMQLAVARLAFDFETNPTAAVEVKVNGVESLKQVKISPQNPSVFDRVGPSFYENLEIDGHSLTFEVNRPQQLFVEIDELEYLLIFIEPKETDVPNPEDAGVVNLADFLDPNRNRNQEVTQQVQAAIRYAAKADKVLYVPDDLYLCGQLQLGSHSQVYLSSGAMLQSVAEWNRDFWPAQAGANETNKDSSFIFIGDPRVTMENLEETRVVDVKLWGRGIVDGNGWELRSRNDGATQVANVKLFRSANVKDMHIDGVYFRNSARWSFNVLLTDGANFKNVKLINNMVGFEDNFASKRRFTRIVDDPDYFHLPFITNTDGFDIDASQHVVVEDSFVMTADDAFTPKVTEYMDLAAPCYDLSFERNVIWTEKAALKIGNETWDDIYDVSFSDNYVIRADRMLSILNDKKPGVKIWNVSLSNNFAERIGGNVLQRFFRFWVKAEGSIHDVMVDGLYALQDDGMHCSSQANDPSGEIKNVEVINFEIAGKPVDFEDVFELDLQTGNFKDFTGSQWVFNGTTFNSSDRE